MKNNADELSLEINSSAEIQSITSETIAITAGVAGVMVECQFGSFPIRNSQGGKLGGYGDTSISLTSTAFDTEVAYNTADADLANGEFWVDYLNGILRGKKKDASTSMTVDYKIVMLNISVDEIEVTASQNIEELGGNAIDLEDGAVDVGTQRVTLASDDPAVLSLATPTTLTGGEKTVTTAGTGEALGTTLATKTIYIRAKSGNTNDVYVGDSGVDKDTNKQIILSSNDSITLNIANRMTVYVDATTNGEGVDYLVMS